MKEFFLRNSDLSLSLLLLLIIVFAVGSCTESPTPAEEEARKVYYDKGCYSKKSGSSPRCWTPEDWAAYCKNTNVCK